MADSCTQGSFAFRCTLAEADLLVEAIEALNEIGFRGGLEPPSAAMLAAFPPLTAEEPWSGFVELMPDPEFPDLNTDFLREEVPGDPGMVSFAFSSMVDFEPLSIAELIRRCCQPTLAGSPIGYGWASTCSRPRIDEFGGGWCAVFADRIEIENTGRALSRALSDGHPTRDGASGQGA